MEYWAAKSVGETHAQRQEDLATRNYRVTNTIERKILADSGPQGMLIAL